MDQLLADWDLHRRNPRGDIDLVLQVGKAVSIGLGSHFVAMYLGDVFAGAEFARTFEAEVVEPAPDASIGDRRKSRD